MGNRPLRFLRFAFLLGLLALASATASVRGDSFTSYTLTESENHHVARLNSNQPYVAGCCVASEDLMKYGTINGTAVEVSFPSTDSSYFPAGNWLGVGMFVQAQDTRFLHVDYGFYMMLVLDASGGLFVDIGLHQTREGAMPLVMPSEELLYARTWQLSGADRATPFTLIMEWDENETVNYSVRANAQSIEFASVHVPNLPNCENIIPRFYTGNVIVGQFPMSRYVHYFQFGITSPTEMANDHWSALVQEPRTLRLGEWSLVERAWSIQGDLSYLDQDWRWGGKLYAGVDARYHMNSHESPNQVLFFHSDQTLPTGTSLWEPVNASTGGLTGVPTLRTAQIESMLTTDYCSVEHLASALAIIVVGTTYWMLRKNKGSSR
jgi:hypothetical protein